MAAFPSIAPSYNAAVEREPVVLTVKFGDGYEQRSARGINNNLRKWSLTFANQTTANCDTIETFIVAQGGVTSFTWTDPTGYAGKWVCRKHTRTKLNYNNETIAAVFEEVML